MNAITRRLSPASLMNEEISPFMPTLSESPLTALARTRPDAAAGIMHRILDIQRDEMEAQRDVARMSLLKGISDNHTTPIQAYINANPGKSHVDCTMETDGITEDNSGWFARGQRVRMRTTFSGNAW